MNAPIMIPAAGAPRGEESRVRGVRTLILIAVLILAGVVYLITGSDLLGSGSDDRIAMGTEMEENHLYSAAAAEYERALFGGAMSSHDEAALRYRLGKLYFDQLGDYEKAAANFLAAKSLAPEADFQIDAGKLLVAALERSGRLADAQRHLGAASALPGEADTSLGRIVATVGDHKITQSDVDRDIQELPPQVQSRYKDARGKREFLQQYVGLELVRRAAIRAGYDKSPEYLQAVDKTVRGLLVERFLDEHIRSRLNADSADVMNFYRANRDSLFSGKSFVEVREQAVFMYQNRKSQEYFAEYVNRLSQADTVKIFEDSIR